MGSIPAGSTKTIIRTHNASFFRDLLGFSTIKRIWRKSNLKVHGSRSSPLPLAITDRYAALATDMPPAYRKTRRARREYQKIKRTHNASFFRGFLGFSIIKKVWRESNLKDHGSRSSPLPLAITDRYAALATDMPPAYRKTRRARREYQKIKRTHNASFFRDSRFGHLRYLLLYIL